MITRKRKLKTIANTNANPDFINDLPRHIVDCILERLPLRDAVRTSILSRRWRNNWVMLQHLDFGYKFYRDIKEAAKTKGIDYMESELKYQYERIINKIFLLHLGPLVKVTLYIPKFESSSGDQIPDTHQWIVLLCRKKIKELKLHYESRIETHLLPSCFYSCLDLTRLELRNLVFTPPEDFKGFHNLVAMKFTRVEFKDNIFENLVSSSPLLEKLAFVHCSGIDHFRVDAPNLECLQLNANNEFKSIYFENVPKLSDITIALDEIEESRSPSDEGSPLLEFLTSLPRITRLSLNGNFLKFLAADALPQSLPPTVDGLKILRLNYMDFANFDEISCALCLIRNTPNLKELEIWANTEKPDGVSEAQNWGYMETQAFARCTLDRLRVVRMEFIMGFRTEMELIEFLLARSPFLEKMFINAEYSVVENDVALNMAIELIRCYRASPGVDFRYLTLRDT